ncbi:hydroxyneurosporene methyltransferase [Bradyrhizobium sp. Arg68]|uniref:acetylserotonin O-methyltransferase n=1 Tax=Bradyrhizobium ivorense TaxID=2511166 RepID=UPI001E52E34C|nr:acetylserotonin O-methyltransferase [Bradyrhizobium ivorense]MCC8939456.1 hydroxyneurosporene methyltransferase [Bradyrhizobium ivorense]
MGDAVEQVMNLIFGRWRSQILYAGVELGIFDHIQSDRWISPTELADTLRLAPDLLYRLMRAQAALGLLIEDHKRCFMLSATGALLRDDAKPSLKHMARLAEGPQHYAIWSHLPDVVRDGKQDAFEREFGYGAFEHARRDADYASRFRMGMSSYSEVQSALAIGVLRQRAPSSISTFCDIGGGHGHLTCSVLREFPHMSGVVFDLPDVIADRGEPWAERLGVEGRCSYVGGDMFTAVPKADAYSLKMILHDWSDSDCVRILSNVRKAAKVGARLYIIEHIVPGPDAAHLSKLFDIHMMVWGKGRERSQTEYNDLLRLAGWTPGEISYPSNGLIGVLEAT